jgi:hypothetical protein
MNKNIILKIPAGAVSRACLKLDEAANALRPYFVSLSPPQRRGMARIGPESFEFLEMSHALAVGYPGLFPAFVKETVFEETYRVAGELRGFAGRLDEVRGFVGDMETIAGDYALELALDFYKTVKIAAMRDLPGAGGIYEKLRPRFPPRGQRRGKAVLV